MTKLASGPMLWRANQEGRLQIREEAGDPIEFTEAWELVATLQADRAEAANGKAA